MDQLQPAWGEAIVEGSLEWSFIHRTDLVELAELRAAIEYFDAPVVTRSLDDLVADFDQPHAHPTHHAVVGRDKGGTIVAYAWNHITPPTQHRPHVWMEMGVHPAWRHHHIGLSLVDWSVERARRWYRHIAADHDVAPMWVGCAVDEGSRVADDIIEAGLLDAQRWFFDGRRGLEDDLPLVIPPVGIELRPYASEMCEEVRRAHNLAFSTRIGAHDVDAESWQASITRADCRPEWSWIAVRLGEENRVIGYAINSEIMEPDTGERIGWTERFGVVSGARGLGLGHALLAASMNSFQEAGCSGAGIGVDTDRVNQAERLFGDLGYEFDARMVLFGRSFED
ncbi:hypothetical protein HMPREF1531_02050 [Propionibacterium sp. oral taxon 192 str. F0372]|uniref:GNAT family N-acetyltransferase n=1 Tax=Propionibacterium sp. oral taxon 192 TaxID=671222 RepID=UPI0003538523|nr:GNAT family N-acetyltransferase [Propionibacterium sp. oral taxon 192]EPH02739.1 hypothetical protein HMPREF1531_02050 [Propionibacterium sp. oral taxon 192 str. F0372]